MGRQRHSHNGSVLMLLSSSMPKATSGYAVRSHALASSLLQHGVQLHVYTKPGFPVPSLVETSSVSLEDTVDNVTYHRIPFYPMGIKEGNEAYRTQAAKLVATLATRLGVSIIHAASDMQNGLPAMYAAKACKCKGIYEYRGMWHYSTASLCTWFPWTKPFLLRQNLELEAGGLADAVLAISEALKRELVNNGLPEEKITVVPNAVDTSRFAPMQPDREIIEKYALMDRRVLGFVGSLTNYEGLESLIDAVLELNWRGKPVTLLVVGDGPGGYLDRLKAWHTARGGHPSIIFTGRVPFEEVPRYYSVMDIMPFPRIPARVCHCVPPLKPVEAMAMGKAVLVSDVAALVEMVQDGQTGLICRAGDLASLVQKLELLVDSPALCMRLGTNALNWVRRERDWSIVSKRVLRVYEALVE